ncbi:MFS transporter [Holdemania massiliensis]|uniref:MFS transporter n=1 Tax=Holdemania massiliensis TaxID=1468449 RepID=UPI001F06D1F7|nr:MFS transporter [Holdemania massiliensis]MCH1939613.1 MFS transporter [Holdemania massiliensis]
MKRYFYLGLGSLAMCVFGLMYNWTVFSPAVSVQLNVSAASVANVFSVCQICFCAGGVLSGFIYYRVPFRASMLIASLMIGVGLFLTSRADQVAMIYACYSVLFSLGAGFAYKALLTTVMTWFNDKPGLASGVLVMGAGLTAFVFNVPTSLIIESLGWRTAMLLLALIAFVLSLVVSLIVRPRGVVRKAGKLEEGEEEGQVSTGQMMKSTRFYVYFIWSVLVLAGCSSLTGTAVSCGISFGISATMAATLSMIISLFNSVSRVFYGIIYDKIGRKTAMGIATTLFIIAVIILYCAFTLGSTALLAVSFIFVGLSFGAVPTISSAYILTTFGKKYYPSNFSIQGTYTLFSPFLGTMLFSALFTATQSYPLSYSYLIAYALIALGLFFGLNRLLNNPKTTAH